MIILTALLIISLHRKISGELKKPCRHILYQMTLSSQIAVFFFKIKIFSFDSVGFIKIID